MSQTPTGKRIKTQYVGIYYRFGKDRMCPDGKPDRCYDITYKDRKTGKFVFEKVGWRSEGYTVQDAMNLRGQRVRENRHPEILKKKHELPKGITVDEAWAAYKKNWLPNLKNPYCVERIYERYIRPKFGTRYILSISQMDIESYKQELLTSGRMNGKALTSSSVSRILADFKGIVNRAFKWNLLDGKNPLLGITVKNVSSKRERFLSKEEAKRILDGLIFFSCDLYKISKVALYTGMRLNEILQLRGEDINIAQGCIHVKFGKTGERLAYIPSRFEKEIAEYLPEDKSEYIFSKDGKQFKSGYISERFAKFIMIAGFNHNVKENRQKIVFHTFRHTFCSWLAIEGVPLYTIAKLAGHKTISMTQRYAKLSPAIQREALERLPF